jgi:signal peptidase I
MDTTENTIPTTSQSKPKVRFFTVFLILILMFAAVFGLNFKTVEVKGESMVPTLLNGRKVLTSKAYWMVGAIKINDIVVCQEDTGKGYFIKRVYGLPGDKIKWSLAPVSWPLANGPYTVPEGKIYLVGDNINHSDDSRKFGPFDQSRLLGKVIVWR